MIKGNSIWHAIQRSREIALMNVSCTVIVRVFYSATTYLRQCIDMSAFINEGYFLHRLRHQLADMLKMVMQKCCKTDLSIAG